MIYTLCTAPDHRRRGIDGALPSALTGRMRAREARTQGVTLQADDDPAPPFFTARGFTAGGRRLARTV